MPGPVGLTEAEMQTVVRRSGEQRAVDAPEALGDRDEPSTDVRQLPQARRSGEMRKRKGGSKLLRLLFVAVLVGIGLVLAKWRTDPEWIRARNPELAHSLERLSFIPGFPKALPPPPPPALEEGEDAGVAGDAGQAAAASPPRDAGVAAAKKASPDAGAAKSPAKPPPPPAPHHPHHGRYGCPKRASRACRL
jgi:hypothetical protein